MGGDDDTMSCSSTWSAVMRELVAADNYHVDLPLLPCGLHSLQQQVQQRLADARSIEIWGSEGEACYGIGSTGGSGSIGGGSIGGGSSGGGSIGGSSGSSGSRSVGSNGIGSPGVASTGSNSSEGSSFGFSHGTADGVVFGAFAPAAAVAAASNDDNGSAGPERDTVGIFGSISTSAGGGGCGFGGGGGFVGGSQGQPSTTAAEVAEGAFPLWDAAGGDSNPGSEWCWDGAWGQTQLWDQGDEWAFEEMKARAGGLAQQHEQHQQRRQKQQQQQQPLPQAWLFASPPLSPTASPLLPQPLEQQLQSLQQQFQDPLPQEGSASRSDGHAPVPKPTTTSTPPVLSPMLVTSDCLPQRHAAEARTVQHAVDASDATDDVIPDCSPDQNSAPWADDGGARTPLNVVSKMPMGMGHAEERDSRIAEGSGAAALAAESGFRSGGAVAAAAAAMTNLQGCSRTSCGDCGCSTHPGAPIFPAMRCVDAGTGPDAAERKVRHRARGSERIAMPAAAEQSHTTPSMPLRPPAGSWKASSPTTNGRADLTGRLAQVLSKIEGRGKPRRSAAARGGPVGDRSGECEEPVGGGGSGGGGRAGPRGGGGSALGTLESEDDDEYSHGVLSASDDTSAKCGVVDDGGAGAEPDQGLLVLQPLDARRMNSEHRLFADRFGRSGVGSVDAELHLPWQPAVACMTSGSRESGAAERGKKRARQRTGQVLGRENPVLFRDGEWNPSSSSSSSSADKHRRGLTLPLQQASGKSAAHAVAQTSTGGGRASRQGLLDPVLRHLPSTGAVSISSSGLSALTGVVDRLPTTPSPAAGAVAKFMRPPPRLDPFRLFCLCPVLPKPLEGEPGVTGLGKKHGVITSGRGMQRRMGSLPTHIAHPASLATVPPAIRKISVDEVKLLVVEIALAKAAKGQEERACSLEQMLLACSSLSGSAAERLGWFFLAVLKARETHAQARLMETVMAEYSEFIRPSTAAYWSAVPWPTFVATASFSAIMDAVRGRKHIHLLVIGIVRMPEWQLLLQALAARPGGAPLSLRLTNVLVANTDDCARTSRAQERVVLALARDLHTAALASGVGRFEHRHLAIVGNNVARDVCAKEGLSLPAWLRMQLGRRHMVGSHPDPRYPVGDWMDKDDGEALVAYSSHNLQCLSKSHGEDSDLESVLKWLSSCKPDLVVVAECALDLHSPFFLARLHNSLNFLAATMELHDAVGATDTVKEHMVVAEDVTFGQAIVQALVPEDSFRISHSQMSVDMWMQVCRRCGLQEVDMPAAMLSAVGAKIVPGITVPAAVRLDVKGTSALQLCWRDQPLVLVSLWHAAG